MALTLCAKLAPYAWWRKGVHGVILYMPGISCFLRGFYLTPRWEEISPPLASHWLTESKGGDFDFKTD